MSSGVMLARKRYITSRQVQKLSSSGPRRSARPAMARWKAWLCTLATPGTADAGKALGACGGRGTSVAMAVIVRPVDRDQHIAPPAVVEQRLRYMNLRHGSPASLSVCRAERRRAPRRYV